MSFELRSDNFGNRIKCIENIREMSNDLLLNNIKSIINIIFNDNGFKNLVCNYILNGINIDNKILNKLYNFTNKLNKKKQ